MRGVLERITLREARILVFLKKRGMTLKEISEALGIPPSTAHGIMTRLMALDLVEKKNGQYHITMKGMEAIEGIRNFLNEDDSPF